MNIGVILAGGVGSRMGMDTPKQYLQLNGKKVIEYSINALKRSKSVDKILVVCDPTYSEEIKTSYGVLTCNSGSTRNESIDNGLKYIAKNFECKKIIILDSARPLINHHIVDSYFEKLESYDAVITGQKIVDSLGCYDKHTLDRNNFYLIQAPEAFDFEIMYSSFDKNSAITATNQQMPQDSRLYINFDFQSNLKVTYKSDLTVIADMLDKYKLIAFDLDGTLTQHKSKLDKENESVLNALKKQYKLVMVGAGSCERIYKQLNNFDIDIIGNYGLQESTINNGKLELVRNESYKVDKNTFIEKCNAMREKFGYTDFVGDSVEFHDSGAVTFPLLGTKAELSKKLTFDVDREKRRKIYKEVCDVLSDYKCFIGGTSSFDIVEKKYNKHSALSDYAKKLGINNDEILYVGDDFGMGGNDEDFALIKGVNAIDYLEITDYMELAKKLKERGINI